jgi:Xaa-Pro aminopeptidase
MKFQTNHRRQQLVERIVRDAKSKDGFILLIGGFESNTRFKQDSSFFYYTGVREPGCFVTIDLTGYTTLYVPRYAIDRSLWVENYIVADNNAAKEVGVDQVVYLGESIMGYALKSYFELSSVYELIDKMKTIVGSDKVIYTINQPSFYIETQTWFALRQLLTLATANDAIIDISSHVAQMRRCKDDDELLCIKKAIGITKKAFDQVETITKAGATNEREIYRVLLDKFNHYDAVEAYTSIVGAGCNATILHYTNNKADILGKPILIDAGASYNGYAADITRVYSVQPFTQDQQDVYQLVLDAQRYAESLVKPGMWLSNKQYPDKSIHHQVVNFFAKYKMDKYFYHGIGHYLGLDVHDVGSYQDSLQPGNIITLEPGLYLRDKEIGVRIEDNYLVTDNGVTCLSREIAK